MGAAAGFFGGLLGGIGAGLVERRRRQDEMRATALQGSLTALANIEKSPNFNPEWIPDLTNASMQSIANFTGTGDKVAGKPGGKANKNASPLAPVQALIGGVAQGYYSQHPQKEQTEAGSAAAGAVKPAKGAMFLSAQEREDVRLKQERAAEEQKKQVELEYQRKLDDQRFKSDQQHRHETAVDAGLKPGTSEYQHFLANGTMPADVKPPVESSSTIAFRAWSDKHGIPVDKMTAANKIEAVKEATAEKKEPRAPTASEESRKLAENAYKEKHGIKGRELTATETQKAIAEQKEAEESPDAKAQRGLTMELARGRIRDAALAASQSGTGAMSDDELRALASRSLMTGQDPPFGLSAKNPLRQRYQKIKADMIISEGVGESTARGAEYKANAATLTKLTELQGSMKGALAGTNLEINRVKNLAKAVDRSKIAKYNQLEQFLKANLTDDPALAKFREALLAARYRYNSMISSVRGGGNATNQVRTETADEILNRFMPNGALDAALDEMQVGLKNVMGGVEQAVKDTRSNIASSGGGSSGTDSAAPTRTATGPNGEKLGLVNGKWVPIK